MNIIVAVDKNWGIGKDGNLLARISEDMRFFKQTTLGHAVIMGRRTFLSLPGQKPLPDRDNYILTKDENFSCENATICHSLEQSIELASAIHPSKDIFFIGGAQVYNAALPLCNRAYVTKINKEYDADTFIPDIDALPEWELAESKKIICSEGTELEFITYMRKK